MRTICAGLSLGRRMGVCLGLVSFITPRYELSDDVGCLVKTVSDAVMVVVGGVGLLELFLGVGLFAVFGLQFEEESPTPIVQG